MSRARPSARRRRALSRVTLVLVAAILASTVLAVGKAATPAREPAQAREQPVAPRILRVTVAGRRKLTVPVSTYISRGVADTAALERSLGRMLPARRVGTNGRVTTVYENDLPATARTAVGLGMRGGTVEVRSTRISVAIAAPVLRQRLRNSCESAALSILLTSIGRPVDQIRLQRRFPKSGALDPVGSGAGRVWGDPDIGYVGRAEGGGVAGGFGVYPGPVAATARRLGVPVRDISGASVARIRRTVLQGRPVMVWIGLSEGPYGTWTSPAGRTIKVNFGEHTVVVHGVREDGRFIVSNPLLGTRELWTPARLQTLSDRLGRRALAAA